jgi:DNA repair exonuclease SbcCD ATPase subunit
LSKDRPTKEELEGNDWQRREIERDKEILEERMREDKKQEQEDQIKGAVEEIDSLGDSINIGERDDTLIKRQKELEEARKENIENIRKLQTLEEVYDNRMAFLYNISTQLLDWQQSLSAVQHDLGVLAQILRQYPLTPKQADIVNRSKTQQQPQT